MFLPRIRRRLSVLALAGLLVVVVTVAASVVVNNAAMINRHLANLSSVTLLWISSSLANLPWASNPSMVNFPSAQAVLTGVTSATRTISTVSQLLRLMSSTPKLWSSSLDVSQAAISSVRDARTARMMMWVVWVVVLVLRSRSFKITREYVLSRKKRREARRRLWC
jgi:hypothetical protein